MLRIITAASVLLAAACATDSDFPDEREGQAANSTDGSEAAVDAGAQPSTDDGEAATEPYYGPLKGAICDYGEADCNQCVSAPLWASDKNDAWHAMNPSASQTFTLDVSGAPNNDSFSHNQGMQRLPTSVGGPNYVLVTRDHDSSGADDLGSFYVGELGRVAMVENQWVAADPESTRDSRVVSSRRDPYGDHMGGTSIMGNYVAMSNECKENAWCEDVYAHSQIWDLGDPTNPIKRVNISLEVVPKYAVPRQIGCCPALTKLESGKYLLAQGGANSEELYFFEGTSLTGDEASNTASFSHIYDWEKPEGLSWSNWQNFEFVTECGTGNVYLVGTQRIGLLSPDNWAQLYQVFDNNGSFDLIHRANKEFNDTAGANFSSGTGLYVDPSGNLSMYAVEKYQGGDQVRIQQFWTQR